MMRKIHESLALFPKSNPSYPATIFLVVFSIAVIDTNVATPALGAEVIEGELKHFLLNGDAHSYDMERGFSRHPIEDRSEGIVVQLGATYIINHIRLLLWDRDPRSYSYYIEVSVDRQDWVRVIDYSTFLCRSWQKLYFSPKVVK